MKSTPHIQRIPARMTPAELIAWRKQHGFSQEDAGNMLGVARRTYLHYERGDTRGGYKQPTVPRLVELAIKGLDAELRIVKYRMGQRSLRGDAAPDG
jgi:transcriptional regulator with XRE-family HTH domain